ncbi:MAG: hypothetical protein J5871_03075 [Bacteroidales bacterium]|nr:hypothetical protein [Bacteroidales bacterium]
MKNTFCTFLVLAGIVLLPSCNKQAPEPADGEGGRYRVTVKLGNMTKAAGITDNDPATESRINTVQLLAFAGDDIDAYVSGTTSQMSIRCSTGEIDIWAVVNCPTDLSEVLTKQEMQQMASKLSDNSLSSFVMTGHAKINVPYRNSVAIDVDRRVARVVIRRVISRISSSAVALKKLDFTLDEIYVSNVVRENYLCDTLKTYTDDMWYNKLGYHSDASEKDAAVDALTFETISGVNLKNDGEYDVPHYFYVYPNYTEPLLDEEGNEVHGGAWSPRQTKLVLKTTLGGKPYYYPLTLKDGEGNPLIIENNCSYEIKEVVITRRGSENEDKPVASAVEELEISVKPWKVVDLGDGGTVEI